MLTRSIEVNGLHVVARMFGTGEPTYVLIHGLGMSSAYLRPLARKLAKHGRVVSLNLPGFGPTRDPDKTLRIGQFATVARLAAKQLGVGPAVWVGHSMGTQIVVEAVVQDPAIATRVVLLAPVVNEAERTYARVLLRFAQAAVHERPRSVLAALSAYLRAGPRYVLEVAPGIISYPMLERAGQLTLKTLIVVGEHDSLTPSSWLEALLAAVGQGRGHTVFGAAHALVHSHAEETAAVIAEAASPAWRPRTRDILVEFTRAFDRRVPSPAALPDDQRPPVLLLPGILERSGYLAALANHLDRAGHRVVAVPKLGWNLASLERGVELALEALGDTRDGVIVAHSKGGLVGKQLLLHPEGAKRLRGMVAIATPFNGSLAAARLPNLPLVQNSPLGLFHPEHPQLRALAEEESVNSQIVNLIPTRDPLIACDSSLPGATNVQLPQVGHFALLRDPEVWDLVAHHVAKLGSS